MNKNKPEKESEFMTLLDVKNLCTEFKSKRGVVRVVDDVSFSVERGKTLAIVGESGSGKSMTSLSIMGLVPQPGGRIAGGQILLEGSDLVAAPKEALYRIRGADIAMVFQEPMTSLNPVLTIGEQIAEGLIYHKHLSRAQARLESIELLKRVGFARAESLYDEYPHQLSGGMRQRVMIAIALSCNPRLLIADEPTTALDVTVQAQILDLLRRLSADYDSGILLITHDLGVVAELADRVVVMYAGQVVEQAKVADLFDDPQHPYTQGLMSSVPRLDGDVERLTSIAGNVPSPDALPKGCRFSTRCPYAQAICVEQVPELKPVRSGEQSARCFMAEGRIFKEAS